MAKPAITLREIKEAALSYNELDTNFENLRDATISIADGTGTAVLDLNDTLNVVGSGGATVTVNPATKTLTVSTADTVNAFQTIAVAGQSNVVADATNDTLTLVAGTGITLTTDAATDSITITNSSLGSNSFSTIAVSGQSDVVADTVSDTLTLVAGSNISITTNAGSDSITINSTASGSGTVNFGSGGRIAAYASTGTAVSASNSLEQISGNLHCYIPIVVETIGVPNRSVAAFNNTSAGLYSWGIGGNWHEISRLWNDGNIQLWPGQPSSASSDRGLIALQSSRISLGNGGDTRDIEMTSSQPLSVGKKFNDDYQSIINFTTDSINLTIKNSVNKGVKIIEADIGEPGTPELVPSIQPAGTGNTLLVYASNELNLGSGTGNVIVESVSGDVEMIGANIILDGEVTINGNTDDTPTDDTAPVSWLEVTANGSTYYLPLYQ